MRTVLNLQTGETSAAENLPQGVSDEVLSAEAKQEAVNQLTAIDAASIRAMREYIASKADAPQILKDREAAAQAARAKLK